MNFPAVMIIYALRMKLRADFKKKGMLEVRKGADFAAIRDKGIDQAGSRSIRLFTGTEMKSFA